uniref:hypothetical protein n=1 Tax=Parasutterella sp. TaxID=2049037 RepID=UPI003AB65BA9
QFGTPSGLILDTILKFYTMHNVKTDCGRINSFAAGKSASKFSCLRRNLENAKYKKKLPRKARSDASEIK